MIFVLFKDVPSATRIADLNAAIWNRTYVKARKIDADPDTDPYVRLVEMDDADLLAAVEEDGHLEIRERSRQRAAPLIGQQRLKGRLFHYSTMNRVWNKEWTLDGPADEFAILILTLLQQVDVAYVWLTDESFSDGIDIDPMTNQKAHALIDDFVRLGCTEEVLQVFQQNSGLYGGRLLKGGVEIGRIDGAESRDGVEDQSRENRFFFDQIQNLNFVPEVK